MDENKETFSQRRRKRERAEIIRWLFLLGCYVGCGFCFGFLCYEWDNMNTIVMRHGLGGSHDMNPAMVAAANFKVGRIIIYAIGVHLFATLIYREHTRDTHKE